MRGRAILLAVVGAAVLGGCAADAPTRLGRRGQTESLTVEANAAADGSVSVRLTVQFVSAAGGVVALSAPVLATADAIAVDGNPRNDIVTTYPLQFRAPAAQAVVTYRLNGAVERYSDIAVVTIPVWTEPDDARRWDPLVHLTGAITLAGSPGGAAYWHGAAPNEVSVVGNEVHLAGQVAMWHDSEVVVAVPADAFPSLPLLPGGPRLDYFQAREAKLVEEDVAFAATVDNDEQRADLLAGLYWGAVIVEIAVPVLVILWRLLRSGAMVLKASAGVPDIIREPPGTESPAVVALVANGGHDIGDEAVATTILDLADRGALEIEAATSEQFELRLGAATGRTAPEQAVLETLRAGAGAVPPRDAPWWRTFRRAVLRDAKAAGLVRRKYPSALFVTSVVFLTLTTLPLWADSPERGVAGLVVGAIFAMLPFVGGYVLSPKGHRSFAEWDTYKRYVCENAELADVGPPGIAVWGKHLVYAAALGAAPVAVKALAPA